MAKAGILRAGFFYAAAGRWRSGCLACHTTSVATITGFDRKDQRNGQWKTNAMKKALG
jgi:hypothetical protein